MSSLSVNYACKFLENCKAHKRCAEKAPEKAKVSAGLNEIIFREKRFFSVTKSRCEETTGNPFLVYITEMCTNYDLDPAGFEDLSGIRIGLGYFEKSGVACRASHFIELPRQTSFCLFLHFFLLICFQWLGTLLPLMCVILVVYCKSCVC